jgi:hypothetical protein
MYMCMYAYVCAVVYVFGGMQVQDMEPFAGEPTWILSLTTHTWRTAPPHLTWPIESSFHVACLSQVCVLLCVVPRI